MKTKIPIVIITGYLGSGKTTLLRRFIERIGKRIAVVMNEFGEIGIDGRVIRGKSVNMVEISGGCVCCSLTGEFENAIREILEIEPDMIIVETTGVAEPDSLIYDIMENISELRIDTIITVVDSYGILKFPEIGYTGRVQIEVADVLILNKMDLIMIGDFISVEERIRKINGRAMLLKTSYCDIDIEMLLGLSKGVYPHPTKNRDEDFDSFCFRSEGIILREKFNDFVKDIPSDIYRVKGFVRFEDGGYLFNYVCGRWEIEAFDNSETELVFIGRAPLKSREYVIDFLKRCEK